MYFRIGKSLDEKLGDRVQAQERFEMALDLEPLQRIFRRSARLRTIARSSEQDWDRAATYLDQEQQHTEQPRTRAKLLVELGKVRERASSWVNRELAVQAYELAIAADSDCEEAALPLVEDYIQARSARTDAEPLAEMLVRKSKEPRAAGAAHAESPARQGARGARQRREGYDEGDSLAAHQLDVTDQETIRGIAEVSYRLKDWASALTNYQKVLTALGEEEVEQRTEVSTTGSAASSASKARPSRPST